MFLFKLRYLPIYYKSKRIKKKAKGLFKSEKVNFEELIDKKKFKDKWFINNFEVFNYFLPNNKKIDFKYLEIGSYEGMSALNVLTYYSNVKAKLIDIWDTPNFNSNPITGDFFNIENNFDYNLNEFKNYKKVKSDSIIALRNIIRNKEFFDYIYIDGSHNGEDVLVDAIESFKILKINGIMIFDDVLQFDQNRKYQVYEGLTYFLKMYSCEIKILYLQNILIIKKIKNN